MKWFSDKLDLLAQCVVSRTHYFLDELLGNLFETNHFEDYANTNNILLLAVQLVSLLFSVGPCLQKQSSRGIL